MDNLKKVSNLVNWPEYDRIMEEIFYNKFGKLLEKKMDEFEENKKELKQNVKRILEDPKVLPTPSRKVRPAIALTKRINEIKEQHIRAKNEEQREKEFDRDKKAQKIREDQLKEKAERAKRDREERAKRVQKNVQFQEAERKKQEELIRTRMDEAKKFAEEQKRLAGTPKCQLLAGTPKCQRPAGTPKCQRLAGTPKCQRLAGTPICAKTPKQPANIKNDKTPVLIAPKIYDKTPVIIAPKISLEVPKVDEPLIKIVPVEELANQRENEMQETQQQLDEVVDMTELDEQVDEISAYDITRDKVPVPATEENYNVDDLSSEDETDPEDSPRKQIPKWAQKDNMTQHIMNLQNVMAMEHIDRFFGRIQQPKVLDFFKHFKTKYPKRRSSSANWDSPMSDPTPGFSRFPKMFQRS